MAQSMKEILPAGDYKVKTVGPSRDWDFQGNNGSVKMATDSIQFEGHEQYWVDVNRAQDKPAPAVGETLNGHIEQDEAGKYPPKFKKANAGGGGWSGNRGGGQASPGAIWSTAMATAAQIVAGYYAASGSKPKSIGDYLAKVEAIAPKVNVTVDKLVAANKPAEKPADTATSESGETPAPANNSGADVVIEDISDEDLGDW
jgi:hypothetical protein